MTTPSGRPRMGEERDELIRILYELPGQLSEMEHYPLYADAILALLRARWSDQAAVERACTAEYRYDADTHGGDGPYFHDTKRISAALIAAMTDATPTESAP